MKAAEKGFVEVVAALLSKGALIDLRNKVTILFLYYLNISTWKRSYFKPILELCLVGRRWMLSSCSLYEARR